MLAIGMPDPSFFLYAIPAVVILGLAKGGFTGLGALGLPVLVLGVEPVQAAAILLPILILQDAVSISVYRRTWSKSVLISMLPGAFVGIGLGWYFASSVSSRAVLAVVGGIAVAFGCYRLQVERRGPPKISRSLPDWCGQLFGLATGFTSQIAHAGGPPFQLWVMSKRLPRDVFVGTTAIFFAIINMVKVPAYFALGQFTADNLIASTLLAPIAVISSLAGVRLIRLVPAERFYTLVYALLVVTGIKLLFDAISP